MCEGVKAQLWPRRTWLLVANDGRAVGGGPDDGLATGAAAAAASAAAAVAAALAALAAAAVAAAASAFAAASAAAATEGAGGGVAECGRPSSDDMHAAAECLVAVRE